MDLTKRLAEGLAYWRQLRRGRPMPSRTDIDPVDLRGMLPYVYLLDVEGPSRYRYRLIGQNIVDNLGHNATGLLADEALFGEGLAEILRMYDFVAANGAPVLNRGRAFWVDFSWRRYVSLLMPLSSDGRTVDRIFAVLEFETVREKPSDWDDSSRALWDPVDPETGAVLTRAPA